VSGEYFEEGYPPPAFYFTVTFGNGGQIPDASFSEVSGISIEMETEAVVEGGENRFIHQLPKSIKHPNLELKRGISMLNSPLVKWCKDTLEGAFIKAIVPQTIIVKLNGTDAQVLRAWAFIDAYPIKWEVEGFNATKNEVAIEKMTFAYTYSKRSK
jgi:phage tail-like protein